jgi:hypothetical protein
MTKERKKYHNGRKEGRKKGMKGGRKSKPFVQLMDNL